MFSPRPWRRHVRLVAWRSVLRSLRVDLTEARLVGLLVTVFDGYLRWTVKTRQNTTQVDRFLEQVHLLKQVVPTEHEHEQVF